MKYYIILLLSFFILICSETPWTYTQCHNYLDSLDLICNVINRNNNGIEICEQWEIKSFDLIINLPSECFNKEYNLEMYIKGTNPLLKKKLILFLDILKNIIFIEKNEGEDDTTEIQITSNDIDEIRECFKSYIKFEKICTDTDIINQKNGELCNELNIKMNNEFCMDIINGFNKDYISKLKYYTESDVDNMIITFGDESKNVLINIYTISRENNENNEYLEFEEQNNNDEENGEFEFEEQKNNDDEGIVLEFVKQINNNDENDYINNNNKNDYDNILEYEGQNDNNDKNDLNNNKKNENDKNVNFNNDNKKNDNDLENYYNRERKDCVEYGLKDNYIFCTKYE